MDNFTHNEIHLCLKKMARKNKRNKKNGQNNSYETANQDQQASEVNGNGGVPNVDLGNNKSGDDHENAAISVSKSQVENGEIKPDTSNGDFEV